MSVSLVAARCWCFGQRLTWLWLVICVCWIEPAAAQAAARIKFSSSVVQFVDGTILPGDERTEFDCAERIHGIFIISGLAVGQQLLQTRWRNPGGKVERINTRRMNIRKQDRVVYLSSSIEFRGASGLLGLMDPGAGFEPYLGRWTVEAINHGSLIGSGSFEVLC